MKYRIASLCVLLPLAGCSSMQDNPIYGENGLIKDRSLEYKRAESGKRLEIPAELAAKNTRDELVIPEVNSADVGQVAFQEQIPRPEIFAAAQGSDRASIRPLEGERVILVDASIDKVWTDLLAYWDSADIALASRDPQTATMETEWIRVEGQDLSPFQRVLNTLKFNSEANEPSMNKLRLRLRPDADDLGRTAISLQQVKYALSDTPSSPDWDEDGVDLDYSNEILFSMLDYMSRNGDGSDLPTLSDYETNRGPIAEVGANSMRQPMLSVKAPLGESWELVNKALDDAGIDVGTRDQEKGKIYLTYRTVFQEEEATGILDWLRKNEIGPISLGDLPGVADETVEENVIYSSDPDALVAGANPTQSELQAMEGFKIWVGDRVVYVFGQDNQTRTNADGELELVKRYQLKFNRARSGVLVSVHDDTGAPVSEDAAEELLWAIKDSLAI